MYVMLSNCLLLYCALSTNIYSTKIIHVRVSDSFVIIVLKRFF